MTVIAISTVPAAVVPAGQLQIVARTRKGKDGKEIPADQKSRSILIPEFAPNVSSKYVSIVVSALTATATAQLAEQWKQDPMIRETDTALYTEDALLLFAAREAENKKLSGAAIIAWFAESELLVELSKTANEKQLARFRAELENIAAPVPNLYTEERALKRIVTLTKHESDAEHPIVAQCVAKLTNFINTLRKQREEIGDVEELDA
jgi:hypothetical protein